MMLPFFSRVAPPARLRAALLTAFTLSAPLAATPALADFDVVESSIADVHRALLSGQTSCEAIIDAYLQRIATYDPPPSAQAPAGLALRSMLHVNANALAQARELDRLQQRHGTLVGPLHCIAVAPKDNIDTADMPTSAGALALANSRPPADAYVLRKVREAGGILIGKANLAEFAQTYTGESTLGGQPLNPYDLSKGPGGSSSGTAVAVSASLAAVGIGSDTGGSVRVPAAATALIGIRPSLRLVSQHGVMPLAPMQDTAGPMCRSVRDCAVMLSVMRGYDAAADSGQRSTPDRQSARIADAQTYAAIVGADVDYTAYLRGTDGLQGVRIGLVRELYGDDPRVNAAIDAAVARMQAAGAIVETVTVPDLPAILAYPSASFYEFKHALDDYLARWPSDQDGHPRSYAELLASGSVMQNFKDYDKDYSDAKLRREYFLNVDARNVLVRDRVNRTLDHLDGNGRALGQPYDVLLYPGMKSLPAPLGQQPNAMGNIRLGSFTGYPSMSMPAAMVIPAPGEPALPVAFEMLARPFDEATLIRIGSAWESLAQARIAPPSTPAL